MEAGLRHIMGRCWSCIFEGKGGKEFALIFSVGFSKIKTCEFGLKVRRQIKARLAKSSLIEIKFQKVSKIKNEIR